MQGISSCHREVKCGKCKNAERTLALKKKTACIPTVCTLCINGVEPPAMKQELSLFGMKTCNVKYAAGSQE